MSHTDDPSDNQPHKKYNHQKKIISSTTVEETHIESSEGIESNESDDVKIQELGSEQKIYTKADRWKALVLMTVVLLVGGAVLIGGGVLVAQHQRAKQEKRDSGAGERATQQLKYTADTARSLAATRGGKFATQQSSNAYRQLAQEIEKKNSQIGFVALLPQGKIQGGGVYIDTKKSTPSALRLSTLIDVTGESNDLVFSITVKNTPAKTDTSQ